MSSTSFNRRVTFDYWEGARSERRSGLAKWETDGRECKRIILRVLLLAVRAVERESESEGSKHPL